MLGYHFLRNKLRIWGQWRKRKRVRLDYKEEVAHLRRELVVVHTRAQAMEMLFILKQRKINRLLEAQALERAPHPDDAQLEKIITTYDEALSSYANRFEERQKAYETTGQYERGEHDRDR